MVPSVGILARPEATVAPTPGSELAGRSCRTASEVRVSRDRGGPRTSGYRRGAAAGRSELPGRFTCAVRRRMRPPAITRSSRRRLRMQSSESSFRTVRELLVVYRRREPPDDSTDPPPNVSGFIYQFTFHNRWEKSAPGAGSVPPIRRGHPVKQHLTFHDRYSS